MECLLHRALIFIASTFPLYLVLFALQNIPFTSSQSPVAVVGPGYATASGKLYIQGGLTIINDLINPLAAETSAFFSLDLTIPWNVTSPPWKSISVGNEFPVANSYQSIAVTPDKTRLVFWGSFSPPRNTSLLVYNIPNNTWSTTPIIPLLKPGQLTAIPLGNYMSSVIDPASTEKGLGVLYAPSGCSDTTVSYPPVEEGLCQTDLDKKTFAVGYMPGGQVPANVQSYSFVYCSTRKSMMLYGGNGGTNLINPSLYEFNPSTVSWTLLQPQGGAAPGDVSGHCMVETTDGSKMLLFGGMDITGKTSSRLFILNLNNMTWTEGADIGAANARSGHACATNGDSLVVWGGIITANNAAVVVNNIPLVYNIPNNTWVQNFLVSKAPPSPTSASLAPTSTPTNTITQPPPPEEKSSNVGAIAGGAVGCVAAITAFGFLVYTYRKNRRDSDDRSSQMKRSEKDNSSRFGRRNNRNDDDEEDDTDPYSDYLGSRAIQLQNASTQHTVDPYFASSLHFSQQFQPSSSAMSPPLHQHLPPQPEMQARNTPLSYGGSPADMNLGTMNPSGVSSGELDSLRFSGISSSPPPPFAFPPQPSSVSLSLSGSPQREEGFVNFIPTDSHEQPIYYDKGKNAFSTGSPQASFPNLSVGQSTYYDGRNSVLSGSFKSPDALLTSTPYSTSPQYIPIGSDGQGLRADYRSPQQLGPAIETSPAAWMAATSARNSIGNPHRVVSHVSDVSGPVTSRGSYYPPPPGHQSPAPAESDLMQKKLKLMKAQHELDLEKMRLEQEAQLQIVQNQLFQSSG
ncbi:hypothetical protein EMPS_04831 [Entomortierella parvispora]|uniref:Uncharacterized protein n=1 Tax=Entomortierella parvispora TaxID=205924 RepID=A0A9P3LVV5_9FUNG|nr:hypothetical protein EMPS_04831 [Entomortierella parvispora]